MRKSITQEFDYGCGIACFAFATQLTYRQAAVLLGTVQANSTRFWVKDFREALSRTGREYTLLHVKPSVRSRIYAEGTIVLVKRSKRYPSGHYLIRHNDHWMDSWINLPNNKNISQARSGFRKRLPGYPMYALLQR